MPFMSNSSSYFFNSRIKKPLVFSGLNLTQKEEKHGYQQE